MKEMSEKNPLRNISRAHKTCWHHSNASPAARPSSQTQQTPHRRRPPRNLPSPLARPPSFLAVSPAVAACARSAMSLSPRSRPAVLQQPYTPQFQSQHSPTSRSDPTSSSPARLSLPTTQPDEVTQQASLLSLRLLFFRIHSSSCLLQHPFWNETHLNLTLSLTTHLSRLTEANEWRGRLKYGNGLVTSDFLVKVTAASEKIAFTKEMMKTMIPIIVGVVVTLLVIFLLVIVLLCRRHKKSKAKKDAEQETEELNQVEIKFDEFGENHFDQSVNMIKANSALTFSDNDSCSTNEEKHKTASVVPLLETDEQLESSKQELKAVVIRDEKIGEMNVIVRETLYNRLHRPQNTFNPKPMDKTAVKQKITRGLVLLAREKPHSEILSKLTSHWVLFDGNDDILFRLNTPKDVATISHQQVEGGEKGEIRQNEEQRWVPPEEADGKEIVDASHGTVFRLGLVLWEIETGLVPFGEIDAINAQRQLGSGILPKMDRVSPEMAELIENCLQIDPLKRPTLASISRHFNGKTKDDGEETEKKSDCNDVVWHP
ncbi:hypothetical protein BLNAU_21293 [Blattamonas nauphoetae]|uniref:Serine-threonine/tyrosine-protein kinase catalytic domain-containing protein n=1 Tax=Blattamonas nauphoetae TaxID=2049346 RepID=A0ABQ9WWU6_9EUKA|nr:hypothetical protein BLNAU_21293 [Blattamonas nauphoetae]